MDEATPQNPEVPTQDKKEPEIPETYHVPWVEGHEHPDVSKYTAGLPEIPWETFLGETRTKTLKRRFCEALRWSGNVTESASKAGVNRSTIYLWRDEDPVFKEWCDEGMYASDDIRERIIDERAVFGVESIKFDKNGVPVARYRDTAATTDLLLAAMRKRRPAAWKEKMDSGDYKQMLAQAMAELARLSGKAQDEPVIDVTPVRVSDCLMEPAPQLLEKPE